MNLNCPLCGRLMIDGPSIDRHHLIPKSRKGQEAELIHKICHRKIHSIFTEKELEKYWHTWERLHSHDEIQKFVAWIQKKHPEFYDGSVSKRK